MRSLHMTRGNACSQRKGKRDPRFNTGKRGPRGRYHPALTHQTAQLSTGRGGPAQVRASESAQLPSAPAQSDRNKLSHTANGIHTQLFTLAALV